MAMGVSIQDRQVRLELLDALANKVPGLIGGSIAACGFVLIWLSHQQVPSSSLAWLYLLIVVNLPLAWIFKGYKRASEDGKFRIARLMAASRVLAGLLWSIGFWTIHQMQDLQLFWFLVAIYSGIAVSVVSTQSIMPAAALGFLLPPFLTTMVIVVVRFDWMAVQLGACLLGFVTCVLMIGRSLYQDGVDAVRHRLDMQALNQTLQQQTRDLGEQTSLLKQTTARLDRLLNLRDMVLAAASHDLRQPAQSISLIARSILAEAGGERLREKAHALETSSSHINNLIARLLDLARINEEDPPDRKAWIDLDGFLVDTERMFQPLAQVHRIALQIELTGGASVLADRHSLERLVHNLLTNALEHSKGSTVTIAPRIGEPQRTGDTAPRAVLELLLADDGVGIEPSVLPAELREAAGELVRTPSGDGPSGPRLGLLIVARLASLADIRVRYRATGGPGTTFVISFDECRVRAGTRTAGDAATVSPAVPTAPTVSDTARTAQRILIVDDDRLIRYGLELLLRARGFEVICWDGLDDSLDLAPAGPAPSLALVDWQLDPATTALEALARIRHWLPPRMPVIVVAGTRPTGEQLALLRETVNGAAVSVLHKPVHATEIEQQIAKLLGADAG